MCQLFDRGRRNSDTLHPPGDLGMKGIIKKQIQPAPGLIILCNPLPGALPGLLDDEASGVKNDQNIDNL
jgi:hypothetical protein